MIVINSLSQGGAERVVSILLERFYHDSRFEVELVLLEDEIAYEVASGVKVTVLSALNNQDSGIKKTLSIPFLAYKLHAYVKQEKPDLLVSFLYRADFVNLLASRFHQVPVIVSERVNASSTYANPSLQARVNKFLIKHLYPKASLIINVSEGTKKDLVDNFAIAENRQIVIYNPYDISKIEALSQESITDSFASSKVIVALSRFRPVKNITMMLQAFAKLEEDATLVLVGSGSEEVALKEERQRLGLEKRVVFVGEKENPYPYLKSASIYLSTSRSEGFPNALAESMICGCAAVSTDCLSGPREILAPDSDFAARLSTGVEYAPYGVLVAVDDVDALKEALTTLLNDDARLNTYQRKAQERVEYFSLESIYQEYVDAFNSVIEGRV